MAIDFSLYLSFRNDNRLGDDCPLSIKRLVVGCRYFFVLYFFRHKLDTIMNDQKHNQPNDGDDIQKRLDRIKMNVKSFPDFPKSGIIFR